MEGIIMDESKLYAFCLQGDVTAAYEYLRSEPAKSKKFQELELKFKRRFFNEGPSYRFKTDDFWIRKVLLAYFQYFTAVLTRKNTKEAEAELINSLNELVPDCAEDDLDEIEAKLEAVFKEKGYSFLGGVTAPFRGPYIWKTSIKKVFNVVLPYETREVPVYFLSDFILLSWAHFATFGKRYAGGWAKPEGLYYVNEGHWKVDLDSSVFQVSYLKHEAQHLRDYSRFPNLPVKDLEYRAKLVELIYEPNSYRLLKKFFYEQKNDSRLPHPYSSHVIMKKLSEHQSGSDYENWDPDEVHKWALKAYDEHTRQLENNENGGI
jgi:hypothetical protein